uniref:peptidylprolyl isomerase n=1 Tax=Myripristis murdjan TaxID=586833 RepID=A0A667XJP7_9TELE
CEDNDPALLPSLSVCLSLVCVCVCVGGGGGGGGVFGELGQISHGMLTSLFLSGTLTDGKTFDCSKARGKPFLFKLGASQVIRGWDEGVAKMTLGEVAKLTCSPDYAYGARGYPPLIPGNSTLIFEVELLKIDS